MRSKAHRTWISLSRGKTREPFVYLEEQSGGRADIKTTGSPVCTIKCRLVFAECRQRGRFILSQQAKITTMMTPIFLTSFLFFAFGCSTPVNLDRPSYIHCQSNSECEPGYCCSIAPIRYSSPECKLMQKEGDVCRPASATPVNMTLGYPDGASVTLTEVHYILCPCADGLTCDSKEGVCKNTGEHDTNHLYEEHKRDD